MEPSTSKFTSYATPSTPSGEATSRGLGAARVALLGDGAVSARKLGPPVRVGVAVPATPTGLGGPKRVPAPGSAAAKGAQLKVAQEDELCKAFSFKAAVRVGSSPAPSEVGRSLSICHRSKLQGDGVAAEADSACTRSSQGATATSGAATGHPATEVPAILDAIRNFTPSRLPAPPGASRELAQLMADAQPVLTSQPAGKAVVKQEEVVEEEGQGESCAPPPSSFAVAVAAPTSSASVSMGSMRTGPAPSRYSQPAGSQDQCESSSQYTGSIITSILNSAHTQPQVTGSKGGAAGSGAAERAALGSMALLSPVRASKAQKAALGSETVLTPVRRSARKHAGGKAGGVHAEAAPLLESTNFAYAPNTAMATSATESPVMGVMGDGRKLKF